MHRILVHTGSAVPIYVQIMDQVRMAVATGALARGAKMPTIRALANEVGVNPNTIARAYLELEREGVLEGGRGRGTFVCEHPPTVVPDSVDAAMDAAVAAGMAAGIDQADLQERFSQAVERVARARAERE